MCFSLASIEIHPGFKQRSQKVPVLFICLQSQLNEEGRKEGRGLQLFLGTSQPQNNAERYNHKFT